MTSNIKNLKDNYKTHFIQMPKTLPKTLQNFDLDTLTKAYANIVDNSVVKTTTKTTTKTITTTSSSIIKKENELKQRKELGIKFKNVTYVNYKNINTDSILFVDTENIVKNLVHPYNIMYKYSSGNEHSIGMNIYCDNIKLSQSRKGTIMTKYNTFLLLGESEQCDLLINALKKIREKFIDYVRDECGLKISKCYSNDLKNEEVKIFVGTGNRFPHIIKLGSMSENNVNTEILNIEQFNELLKDHRYNKENSESYYVVSMIVNIACCVYDKLHEGKKISFKPYVRMMEIKYSKAHCIPLMKTKENIVITDNVLVL